MAHPWEIGFAYFWSSGEKIFSLSTDGGWQHKAPARKKRSQWEYGSKGFGFLWTPSPPTFFFLRWTKKRAEGGFVLWTRRVRINKLWYGKMDEKTFSTREFWESLMHDSTAGVADSFEKTGHYLISEETSCL